MKNNIKKVITASLLALAMREVLAINLLPMRSSQYLQCAALQNKQDRDVIQRLQEFAQEFGIPLERLMEILEEQGLNLSNASVAFLKNYVEKTPFLNDIGTEIFNQYRTDTIADLEPVVIEQSLSMADLCVEHTDIIPASGAVVKEHAIDVMSELVEHYQSTHNITRALPTGSSTLSFVERAHAGLMGLWDQATDTFTKQCSNVSAQLMKFGKKAQKAGGYAGRAIQIANATGNAYLYQYPQLTDTRVVHYLMGHPCADIAAKCAVIVGAGWVIKKVYNAYQAQKNT